MTPEEQYERSLECATLQLLRVKIDALRKAVGDGSDLAFDEAFNGVSNAFERVRPLPSIAHAAPLAMVLAADLRRLATEIRIDGEYGSEDDLELSECAEWLEDRCAWGRAESKPPRPGYRRLMSGGWIPEDMPAPPGEQLRP